MSSIGDAKVGMFGSNDSVDDAGHACQAAHQAVYRAVAKHDQAASDSGDPQVQERLAQLYRARFLLEDACKVLSVAWYRGDDTASAW
jgi:hypothetical protein